MISVKEKVHAEMEKNILDIYSEFKTKIDRYLPKIEE